LPLTRRQVFERIKFLEITNCPFVNLPEKDARRWGQGLTAEKMNECVWVLELAAVLLGASGMHERKAACTPMKWDGEGYRRVKFGGRPLTRGDAIS
jgi:hypothetical protein